MISQVASWLKSYYPDGDDRLIEFPVSRRQALVIGAVVVSAVGLVSYAVHVDRKRRADPNYKQTIRERRKKEQAKEKASSTRPRHKLAVKFPKPDDLQAIQNFIIEQLTIGDYYFAMYDYPRAVFHVSNAIVAGASPQLLEAYATRLDEQGMEMLMNALPAAQERAMASLNANNGGQ